jgi:hypothetical protein
MTPLYYHNKEAYIVKRSVLIHHFAPSLDKDANMEYVQMYRDWVGADHVLRTPTHFLFCETVRDTDFEEIN